MEIIKNIVINLRATGLFAVLAIWCLSIAAIGIFGKGSLAYAALGILAGSGALIRR